MGIGRILATVGLAGAHRPIGFCNYLSNTISPLFAPVPLCTFLRRFDTKSKCLLPLLRGGHPPPPVVGYQNVTINDTTAGGCSSVLCTIPTVGATLSATTLSDFQITPPDGGLSSELSVWLMTFDTAGQVNGDYCYLDETSAGMMGVDPGWYTKTSVEGWAPESADAVVVPFGSGVQILSDCGATVTFAGEVVAEDKSFAINDTSAGGCTTTGNCSPVDLTLGDFAITPPDGGLSSELSVWLMTFDTAGQVNGDYCYLDETSAGMMGVDPGWYSKTSVEGWAPESAGDVDVGAGEMFQILSDCGASITVPSAL